MDRPAAATQSAARLQPLVEALQSRGICVHYTTWVRFVREQGLPAKKIGRTYYVYLADLDAWIAEQGAGRKEVIEQ